MSSTLLRRSAVIVMTAALSGALAACGGSGDQAGAAVDIQAVHPTGAVVQVVSVQAGGDRTRVSIRVINGRDRDITLNSGSEGSYLLTDSGEKLVLLAPPTNANLNVPAGQTLDGVLVFEGVPPRGGEVVMVLNERGSPDNIFSNNPRFEFRLPLDGAFVGNVGAEVSALSGMRSNAVTTLRPMRAEGSSLDASGRSTSQLRAVEALRTELGAVQTERGTVVSLEGDVTFDFDRATIRQEARATLDRLAGLLRGLEGGTIRIEGHTDSRGEDDYNQTLSERRADAVAAYLVEQGVSRDRLQTAGYGASRPVAPNAAPDGGDDEQGRQRNRRVEVIVPDSGSAAAAPMSGGESRLEPAS